jgi:hypothetical protein
MTYQRRTDGAWGLRGLTVLELNKPDEHGQLPTAKMIADAMVARGYADYTPDKVRAALQNMRRQGHRVPYLRASGGRP